MDWLRAIGSVLDIALLTTTLRVSVPLILGAMGGLMSERSGVLNIGIEGMMLVGSCLGALGAYYTGNPWIGLLIAVVAGALMGLVHAYISITWQGNQGISGLALFLFSVGFTGFLLQLLFQHGGNTPNVKTLPLVHIRLLEGIPIVGKVLNDQPALVYFALVLPFALHFFFYHTRWGSWVRGTGENPSAAAVVGINPMVVRYICVTISGILAAMGGAYLSLSQLSMFLENMTAGRGFIALAAVIFGSWRPLGAFAAALFFGVTEALELTLQIQIPDSVVPREIFMALPYVLTVAVLAGFMARAVAPASLSQPYNKESR